MNNILNITSRQNLEDAINCFSYEEIDYFYSEYASGNGGAGVYRISIGLNNEISAQTLAEKLTDVVLPKYELRILHEILRHNFIDFSVDETEEIIKTAQNSINIFNQIYNRAIFVKNLTNIIENSNNISIEGFLNFRIAEYRRIAYMLISDAIEQFLIKEEYNDFIKMIKYYADISQSQIDLIHIIPNSDGSFMFYNFKKERIRFEIEEINSIEIFVTTQDMLMSILISLIPKRIIWHENRDCNLENIKSTIKQIFDNRFSVCKGCELCKSKE